MVIIQLYCSCFGKTVLNGNDSRNIHMQFQLSDRLLFISQFQSKGTPIRWSSILFRVNDKQPHSKDAITCHLFLFE